MPAFAPTAAAYKRVEHQKIDKSAKGAKLEIAADEIAQIIAGVVTGIAGVAHFANLASSLKVGFANESANETIDKTFVDEDTLTLAVLQLTKTMTKGSALLLCPCNASAYKINVHGEVTVITATNQAGFEELQKIGRARSRFRAGAPLMTAAANGHVAIVQMLLAAKAQVNLASNVRVPPPPRARRALSRSRPPRPLARERESAPDARGPRAFRVARSSRRARGAEARVREREPPPPPRFAPALFADDVARARVARAARAHPAVPGSTRRPP